jgi:UDP-N-acetylmuramoylalanine--D-glutamate ligase
MIDEFNGRRITVMGLGRFGGGVGVTRWLADRGAQVLVTDLAPAESLGESVGQIEDLINAGAVELRLGGHAASAFTSCDLVIANPAVPRPWENEYLCAARAAGVPVTTEIRLVVERLNREHVIGVTGTAGKSTTAAMVHHILAHPLVPDRQAFLGGNIGGSLLHTLEHISTSDRIVLELSSAQLYWLGEGIGYDDARGFSPHVAVLTNLAANHLDWHGSLDHYRESKQNIFRYQQPGDHRLTEDDLDPRAAGIPLRVPGRHNQRNAQFAILAADRAAGVDPARAAEALSDFPGLPHRLQLVAEHDGRRFYNDSKCTTPGATVLAVEAFEDAGCVHLIAGGYDKQIDLAPIAGLSAKLAGLYTIGTTGSTIAAEAGRLAVECATLDRAVAAACERMEDGDVLLLSPGCASWDQFDHYEQRGEAFIEAVRATIGASAASSAYR